MKKFNVLFNRRSRRVKTEAISKTEFPLNNKHFLRDLLKHGFSTGGEFPTRGEFCICKGGILYLEFCLRCNVVEACNIVASSSVSLLIVFVK